MSSIFIDFSLQRRRLGVDFLLFPCVQSGNAPIVNPNTEKKRRAKTFLPIGFFAALGLRHIEYIYNNECSVRIRVPYIRHQIVVYSLG